MESQAITFDQPLKQATTVPVPAGVSFDSPVSNATSVPVSSAANGFKAQPVNQPAQSTPAAPAATIGATPGSMAGDPLAAKLSLWAQNVQHDLLHGTDITGIGRVLKAMGAHGLEAGVSPETAKFMGSLPLGLLRATQGGAETAQPGQRVKGAKDVAGGLLDAATIPSAFVAPEGAEVTAAGMDRAGDAIASGTGKVASAVRKPFSLKAVQEALQNSKESIQQGLQSNLQSIQDTWHNSVRDLFDDVAKEAGVKPKPTESIRSVAANTAAAVKAKASAIYKQLDQAVGGTRFQTFDEQINNVKRALRNSAGIDPDADGRLIERINSLEDARATALDQAKTAGVDPKLIDHANTAWRQASALEDLSKHIQAATSGLRADIAQGVNAAQEALSPAKLASRANRLYSTGRLQQAVGESRADELLKAIEITKQQAQNATENAIRETETAASKAAQRTTAVRRNQMIGGAVAASAGVPAVWTWLKHILGE